VNDDRTTTPLADLKEFESMREDRENSYAIAYRPDPSNRNEGFRKIKVEILPDEVRSWRVRHRVGYRPRG
jgi:hypothetical protein